MQTDNSLLTSFKAYLKEHIANTSHNHILKSVIVEHSHNFKYVISFDKTKVIASAPSDSSWIIHEALEIEKHLNNFNREDDYMLSQSWTPLIHLLSN